jgi:hypothetical protein
MREASVRGPDARRPRLSPGFPGPRPGASQAPLMLPVCARLLGMGLSRRGAASERRRRARQRRGHWNWPNHQTQVTSSFTGRGPGITRPTESEVSYKWGHAEVTVNGQ